MDDLICSLTDVNLLKQTYLSLSNADAQKFYSQLVTLSTILKTDNDTLPEMNMIPTEWPMGSFFFEPRKGQVCVFFDINSN